MSTVAQPSAPDDGQRLNTRADWPAWYIALQVRAKTAYVWELIDPDGKDVSEDDIRPLKGPDSSELIAERTVELEAAYYEQLTKWQEENPTADDDRETSSAERQLQAEQTGRSKPKKPDPVKFDDIKDDYKRLVRDYTSQSQTRTTVLASYRFIEAFILRTVNPQELSNAQMEQLHENNTTVQALVRILRRNLAPSASTTTSAVREEYNNVLSRASRGNVAPMTWHADWHRAYGRARAYNIPEVQGVLAAKSFLRAVGTRLAPTWAAQNLNELIRDESLDRPILSLDEYGRIFGVLCQEDALFRGNGKGPGLFATLGGRLDKPENGNTTKKECPCGAEHRWHPHECGKVRKALTGESIYAKELTNEEAARIKDRVMSSAFDHLRGKYRELGWLTSNANRGRSNGRGRGGRGRQSSSQAQDPTAEYPGRVVAVTICGQAKEDASSLGFPAIFSTPFGQPHVLSNSTVYDSCGGCHLVNNKELLVEGSYKPCTKGEFVEAGTTRIHISGTGTRVIKNALHGKKGRNTEDLELKNVAVVEGFHVNIVSEARLAGSGVWYCGLDATLRYGKLSSSVVIAQLVRKENLTFLEYKPISSCSPVCLPMQVSSAGLVMTTQFDTLPYRKPDYQKAPAIRNDDADLWHLRAGHLGPEALQHLVYSARGVKIKGPSRVQCEHCAVTHAQKVISKTPSEDRAIRPYYRIFWDLFDFPASFRGYSWLLIIKDEYSARLFGFPLRNKTVNGVFEVIRTFEIWVRRQRGLAICKIRMDNERAVIGIKGETAFEQWVTDTGIDLELPPAHTKEPTGGAERAGLEIILRGIRMRTAAGLPEGLWDECALAGIFIYNISPRQDTAWKSPSQVEEEWFQQHFRWWAPEYVHRMTRDLRPHWGGIYAYGCRAYPLSKDKERGVGHRHFKVFPRGHIGYLVGYVANTHNLYRIWIPALNQVVITRNVAFDELKFYSKEDEAEALPVAIASSVVEDIQEPVSTTSTVLELLGALDAEENDLLERTEQLEQPVETQSSVPALKDVSTPGTARESIGLATPEPTPDPESMPEATRGDAARAETGSTETAVVAETVDPETVSNSETGAEHSDPSSNGPSGPEATSETPALPDRPRRGKARDYGPPTRRSQRQPKPRQLFATLYSSAGRTRDDESDLERRSSADFIQTYLPDQEADWKDDLAHRTLHEVLHAAVRRDQVGRKATTEAVAMTANDLPKAPNTWKELLNLPTVLRNLFIEAARQEIKKLMEKGTWEVIDRLLARTKPLPLKWVFTYKLDQYNRLDRCKARICVRGDLQAATIHNTYAATLAAKTFRLAIALAAQFDLEIFQYDVVNAFLNACVDPHDEPVTCELPDGFKIEGKCVRLRRALYGLRDAPHLWYKELSSTLRRLGLAPAAEEPCLYQDPKHRIIVIFYVDDILIMFHRDNAAYAATIVNGIKAAYELKDQGPAEYYLGVRILRDRTGRKIFLAHDSYIETMAKKFDLADNVYPATPLPITTLTAYKGEATAADIKTFQEKVGSVLYTSILVRPDTAFAVALLSRSLTNPGPEHLRSINQTIRYLYGTRHLALSFGSSGGERIPRPPAMIVASDASYADDEETRRSSQGFIVTLFGGPIQWRASRQPTVTTSTTEAELLSLQETAKEVMALRRLFRELAFDPEQPYTVFCDNKQTIRLVVATNERITTRLRHVDIQNMWLRQEYAAGRLEIEYMATKDMPADGLTKNLSREKFLDFRAHLNLTDVRGIITKKL